MTALAELKPQWDPSSGHINFLCPKCRKGRVMVAVVEGEPRDGRHGANALPPDWSELTIVPSIADEGRCTATKRVGCPGWHGFITNGEAK